MEILRIQAFLIKFIFLTYFFKIAFNENKYYPTLLSLMALWLHPDERR